MFCLNNLRMPSWMESRGAPSHMGWNPSGFHPTRGGSRKEPIPYGMESMWDGLPRDSIPPGDGIPRDSIHMGRNPSGCVPKWAGIPRGSIPYGVESFGLPLCARPTSMRRQPCMSSRSQQPSGTHCRVPQVPASTAGAASPTPPRDDNFSNQHVRTDWVAKSTLSDPNAVHMRTCSAVRLQCACN